MSASLATQRVTLATSAAMTFRAPSSGGETLQPGDRTCLWTRNASGAAVVVTVTATASFDGLEVEDLVVSVANGEERVIGPLPVGLFADSVTGLAAAHWASVAGVTVACVRQG